MSFVREGPVTVKRVTPPEIDIETGRYGEPITETFTLMGSLQPVVGEDLEKLPSGFRVFDAKVLFLHESLEENDIIVYGGSEFYVNHKDEWDPYFSPIPHYGYILLKDVAR